MSPALPSNLVPSLEKALALLAALTQANPEFDADVKQAKPLWQEALVQVWPEWGTVLGHAVGWLDQASTSLVKEGAAFASSDTITAYQGIGSKLDALSKVVSNPPSKSFSLRVSPDIIAPLVRLERILADKKALDTASQERIQSLRHVLDLGDAAREVCALVWDALPHLTQDAKQRSQAISIEACPTMFEAQSSVRQLKVLTRAQQSLDLVQQRLGSEFAQASLVNRQILDQRIQEEQQLHSRMNTLSDHVGRLIAGQHIENQSKEQTQQLASIAPSNPSPPKNWLSFLPASSKPNLSKPAQKALKKMDKKNVSTDEFWIHAADLKFQRDPEVKATTELPRSKEILINALSDPQTSYKSSNIKTAIVFVNDLLSKSNIEDITGLNKRNLQELALRACSGENYTSNLAGWNIAAQLVEIASRDQKGKDWVISAARTLQLQKKDGPHPILQDNIVKVFEKWISPTHIEDALNSLPGLSPILVEIADRLPASLGECVHIQGLMCELKCQKDPKQRDKDSIERLNKQDRVSFAHAVLAAPEPCDKKWRNALLDTSFCQDALLQGRTPDNEWAFLLKDMQTLKERLLPLNAIPSGLLAHAIATKDHKLATKIAKKHAQGGLTDFHLFDQAKVGNPLLGLMNMG